MPWKTRFAIPFGLFVGGLVFGEAHRFIFGQLARICGLASLCGCRRRGHCEPHQASRVFRDGGHEELVTGSAQAA